MANEVLDAAGLFRLDGECAVVTGAGAGIGRGIAEILASAGASVLAVDLDPSAAEETAGRIVDAGGKAVGHGGDVADEAGPAQAMQKAVDEFGRLDILVNNAGIYPPGANLPEIDWDTYRRTYEVNVFGAIRCTAEAARRMGQGGRIINMSSMEALRPSGPTNTHYSSTKAALNGVTRSSAVDLAQFGIRVNAIMPGLVKTEGTSRVPEQLFDMVAARAPSGRVGDPLDIAGAALFLASRASAYVNGQCIAVDGGMTIT